MKIEGVVDIKTAVFNHFADHFPNANVGRLNAVDRLNVLDLTFKTITEEQNGDLINKK